jgi:hypothetical protein
MIDVRVEFVGGPLDGTRRTVGITRAGRPPDLFTVDASTEGSRTRSRHAYRIGPDPEAGQPWRYEYRGIRPG